MDLEAAIKLVFQEGFELLLEGLDKPGHFRARVYNSSSKSSLSDLHHFQLSLKPADLNSELERLVIAGKSSKNDLQTGSHMDFGQKLYRTVFAGRIEELWQQCLKAQRQNGQ